MKYSVRDAYRAVLLALSRGTMPTLRDIAAELGTNSTSIATNYVNKMLDEDMVEVTNTVEGGKMYIWPPHILRTVQGMANAALSTHQWRHLEAANTVVIQLHQELPVRIVGIWGDFTPTDVLGIEAEISEVYQSVMPKLIKDMLKAKNWNVITVTVAAERDEAVVPFEWSFSVLDWRVTR